MSTLIARLSLSLLLLTLTGCLQASPAQQSKHTRSLEHWFPDPGAQALAVMEQHLARQPFFVGEVYSVADIALFAYTHAATDGGFDLDVYPQVQGWLNRVRAQPGFIVQRV